MGSQVKRFQDRSQSDRVGDLADCSGRRVACAYTLAIKHRLPLPDAILAERKPYLSKHAGWLSYYADSSAAGRPLVLIHSVNVVASAYEMGPLFRHYRGQRPVFALDLPGYGFSYRMKRADSPDSSPTLSPNSWRPRSASRPTWWAFRLKPASSSPGRPLRSRKSSARSSSYRPAAWASRVRAGIHSKQGRVAWPVVCTPPWPCRCGDDRFTT